MMRFKSQAGQARAAYLSSLLVLVFRGIAAFLRRSGAAASRHRPLDLGQSTQAAAL